MSSTWAEQVWAVLKKDVLLEARSRVSLNATLFFAAIVLLTFSFALGPDRRQLASAASGLLWLAFIFSGLLAFGRIYQLEMENSAFEGLLLLARNRSAIYMGKVLGAMAVMLAIEAVVLPMTAVLYTLDVAANLPLLILSLFLGTTGFAAIGALYGALTASLRSREVLLPLLLLPVTAPVILAAVKATSLALTGGSADVARWVELLLVFDVVFVTAGLLTFEYAPGE